MAGSALKDERKYQEVQSTKLYHLQREQENLVEDWKNHCVALGKQLSQKQSGQLDCVVPPPPAPKVEPLKTEEKKEDKPKSEEKK